MVLLKGWKYAAMVGTVVGAIGLAIYPIIVSPMMNPEPYSKLTISTVMQQPRGCYKKSPFFFTEKQQAVNRSGINQEEVQPGSKRWF